MESEAPAATIARPVVLFGLGTRIAKDRLIREFAHSEMTALFTDTGDDFINALDRLDVFAAFLDMEHDKNLSILLSSLVPGSRQKWVLMSRPLSISQSRSLYNMGVADVLFHPVHPVLIPSRARLMLTRYLKDHSFPPEVVLPAGLSAREVRENARADRMDDDAHVITVKSDGREVGDETSTIRGESRTPASVSVVKGEQRGNPAAQILTADPTTNSFTNLPSGETSKPMPKIVSISPAAKPTKGRGYVIAADDVIETPGAQLENAAFKRLKDSALAAGDLDGVEALTTGLRVILEQMREYSVDLKVTDGEGLEHLRLPSESDVASVHAKGYRPCIEDLRRLMRDGRDHLAADRMMLLSYAPTHDEQRYHVILGSDDSPRDNELLPEWLLPELIVSAERGGPILITQEVYTSPTWGERLRPDWERRIAHHAPRALAVMPLFRRSSDSQKSPIVFLLAVFGRDLDAEAIAGLEGVLGRLSIPHLHYSYVDFLSRAYRGLTGRRNA